ncbi:MAG: protein-L-isoaspartate(D-aspartate) O-methyltransferase [Deltaproteobacteria bacterium]|nr:protein-L-isoaspartate(D-aspartate) O-methyltransferase [Deltaproteobacteria bacterium]
MINDYEIARERMIEEQLKSRDIRDPRVLQAMGKVSRHLFVPQELKGQAYEDRPLPIGQDQTISQPYMVALMVQALELRGNERILEVGTGSGYATAVLAELCAQVYSMERLEALATRARFVLANLSYDNVRIITGDGTLGLADYAPYDGVVISAAAPCLPRPLLEQLKPGGRLVVPMGEQELQALVRIRKTTEGLEEDYLGECHFVKLIGTYGWDE